MNGNLTRKTDARGVRVDYVYDSLDRVTQRNYSTPGGTPPNYQATPNVTYTYDNLPNAKGRLTKVQSSVSTTEYTAFDILGRVTAHKQTTDGQAYTTGYAYNLSGALTEQQYPSGRVVKNTLDADGSMSQVQSAKPGQTLRNYANAFSYSAAGAVTQMRLGNGLWETTAFNSRLQPTRIALGTGPAAQNKLKLDYSYGTAANNGNVLSQTITVPGVAHPFVQNYIYDELNRLKSATETQNSAQTWKQTFTYDRYGNRRFDTTGGGTTTLPQGFDPDIYNPTISPTNNRFSSGQGYSYDPAGNTTADAEGRSFVYDAENKQVEVKDSLNATIGQYSYDGDGKRVKKYVPATGETTVFVYDAAGKLVGEYSTTVQTGPNAKAVYTTNDHLGSPRVNTDATGQVVSRHDYHPFGEEIARAGYGSDSLRKQFTGYERDNETDLDYAKARMYSNRLGRFTTTDPIYFQMMMAIYPQRFNLYGYSRNNPYKWFDPDGERVYLRGDTTWLQRNVFYEMVGGEETFNTYFHISNGQIVLNDGVDAHELANANSGVQLLGELVNSTDNYLYYAGTNGQEAAALFEGSFETNKKGELKPTSAGKIRIKRFEGRIANEQNAEGTLLGTRGGGSGTLQPVALANGDAVFFALAYNTNAEQIQGSVSKDYPIELEAQQSGVGQAVRPVSLFIHESAENLVFAQQSGRFDYSAAHSAAIRREATIRRDLKITGGFAGGGEIKTNVPKK